VNKHRKEVSKCVSLKQGKTFESLTEAEKSKTFRRADFCVQKLSGLQKKRELKMCDKKSAKTKNCKQSAKLKLYNTLWFVLYLLVYIIEKDI
jgi:hypothetical protein